LEETFQRRLPFVEKKISELAGSDSRVRITGTVLDSSGNMIVVDDGSGRINVSFEDSVSAEANKKIRVFGRVLPKEDGFEMEGDFIQDMNDVDMEVLNKIQELERR
jgi:hypothetical protein